MTMDDIDFWLLAIIAINAGWTVVNVCAFGWAMNYLRKAQAIYREALDFLGGPRWPGPEA